ncbi:MAG: hypothetical protein AAF798_02345 [Bacteroidota bacterium]
MLTEIEAAEILLIPGSTIAFIREMKDEKLLEWIRKINATKEIIELAEMQMEQDARKDLSLWEMLKHAKTLLRLRKLSD